MASTEGSRLPGGPPAAAARKGWNKRGGADPARTARRHAGWDAADWLREHSALQSVALCRLTPIREDTGAVLHAGPRGAHFGGLKRCGSPWSCPLCAQNIAAGRVAELEGAVAAWHARGGSCAMVTLTMRHARGDALGDLWDAKGKAWASVRQNRRVRAAAARAGLAGTVCKTECTHGANGWHLHLHVLAFFDVDDGAAALDDWGPKAFEAWQARLGSWRDAEGRQLYAPDVEHGYVAALVRPGLAAQDVAAYMAKDGGPTEALAAAHELAGHVDTKHGAAGNVSTWGLLARAMAGDVAARAAWSEWESASKGRRALVWTKALRRELVGADVEDDELAGEELGGEAIAHVHPEAFKRLRRKRRVAVLLDVVEAAYAQHGAEGAQRAARGLLAAFGLGPGDVYYPDLRARWGRIAERERLGAAARAEYLARTAQTVLDVAADALSAG